MARRWWKWLLLTPIAVSMLVWGADRLQMIHWVGRTELEVEFTVTDAATGSSVPGARVEVQSDGGFYEEQDKQEFVLITDAGGGARKVCRHSMCFGTQSGLKFTDTFAVHLPWWKYRVVAEGFERSEWADLDVLEFQRQAKQHGPDTSKLVVPKREGLRVEVRGL